MYVSISYLSPTADIHKKMISLETLLKGRVSCKGFMQGVYAHLSQLQLLHSVHTKTPVAVIMHNPNKNEKRKWIAVYLNNLKKKNLLRSGATHS